MIAALGTRHGDEVDAEVDSCKGTSKSSSSKSSGVLAAVVRLGCATKKQARSQVAAIQALSLTEQAK